MDRPYKTWGYPYVPIIAIIGMVGLFIATLIEDLVPSLIGLRCITSCIFILYICY